MNFFEHQDRARRNSQWLIGLFIASVLFIILAVYSAFALTLGTAFPQTTRSPVPQEHVVGKRRSTYRTTRAAFDFWNPALFALVAVPTSLVIGGGSLHKIQSLRAGGSVIATDMGGRLVSPDTPDLLERQLLNVVEEMAIAAGISVPNVYVMDDESGINAFAAGFNTNNAVIGVTRGTLEQLSRDELQGVIGHEFSHILNGDMRLNLNLVGWLHGLLMIYIIGRVLTSFRSRDSRENQIALFGLALIVIGGIGMFCSRLIQSAVSRQREFLADASAVQFTRSLTGISGALRKIAGYPDGSRLYTAHAEESSHMFFGNALGMGFFSQMFATHPPLEQRIQRLEGTKGKALVQAAEAAGMPSVQSAATMGFAGNSSSKPAPVNLKAEEVAAQVGTVGVEHYAYAHELLKQLPESLHAGVRERQSAIAIVYSLLLDRQNAEVRTKQVEWLRQVEPLDIVEKVQYFADQTNSLDDRMRLPLLDLTVPALRQSTSEQCQQIFKCIQGLANADGQWSLSEFALFMVLWHRLNPKPQQSVEITALSQVWQDCLLILSALARVGQTSSDNITYAFRSGLFRLPGAGQQTIPEQPLNGNLRELKQSLDRLSTVAPKLKQAIVDACAHTVMLDNKLTIKEAELLRAIVIALDCPLPPFLTTSLSSIKA
jgi:Zn-dependent protease with chaperone function